MPKSAKKKLQVATFIRGTLEEIYIEKSKRKITKKNMPEFTSKEELVSYVLGDPRFLDSDLFSEMTKDEQENIIKKGITVVSKNTIRGAIKYLFDNALIDFESGKYVWRPSPSLDDQYFPILSIAPQTTVTMNVPENILFLTVPQSFSTAIADYLSAQFYKDDILFIPLGQHIMCVGVLPKSEISDTKKKDTNEGMPSNQWMQLRIKMALHKFKVKYPSFTYNFPYEMEYAMHHNDDFQDVLHKMTDNYIEDRTKGKKPRPDLHGKQLKKLQNGFAFVSMLAERQEATEEASQLTQRESSVILDNNEDEVTDLDSDEYDYDELDETEDDTFDCSLDDDDPDLKYYGAVGGDKPVDP